VAIQNQLSKAKCKLKDQYLKLKQRMRQADPGFLALKRSFKTFIAIMLSLAIFWETPGMAMFSAIAAMLFSRSQVGFTIGERRFTMLLTGVVMALIVFPISWFAQNDYTAVGFVFLASFVAFFLIGNRVLPDFPVVSVLGLSVVTMAFSSNFQSALRFSGMFLIILMLVFTLHFILWPTRPRKRLRLQLLQIAEKIKDYQTAITAHYADAETGMRLTQEKSDDVRKSLGDFGRLWSLFGVKAASGQITEAHYQHIYQNLGKIYDELLLLWQFRVGVWDSTIFKEKIISEPRLSVFFQKLTDRNHPDLIKPSDVEMAHIKNEIRHLAKAGREAFEKHYHTESHSDWVAVINTLQSMEALLQGMDDDAAVEEIHAAFSPGKTVRDFISRLFGAPEWLNISNAGFRLGMRSALIIGSVMAFSEFLEPEYGYWPVLFAVLLIRPNLGISIKVGRERLLGTIAGAMVALPLIMLFPPLSPFVIATILISTLLMLWFINLNLMLPMVAALTFMVLGVFNILEPENSSLVWLRILYTLAIAGYVVLVSAVLWPEKARRRFAFTLAEAIGQEREFFRTIIKRVTATDVDNFSGQRKQLIRDKINQLNEVIDATRNEILQENVIVHGLNIRSFIMRLLNTLQAMETASRPCAFSGDFEPLKAYLNEFADTIDKAFEVLIDALKNRTSVGGFPDVRASFEKLRKQYKLVKYHSGDTGQNISRYWVNSTFIWNFRSLIFEMEAIKNEIELKMKEA
jgi:uncharacterized membrane protein YgaE (UPF0421/DUF939 family)